jgi:hypothetical protein
MCWVAIPVLVKRKGYFKKVNEKRGFFMNKVLELIGTTILKQVLHIAYNGKERDTLMQ